MAADPNQQKPTAGAVPPIGDIDLSTTKRKNTMLTPTAVPTSLQLAKARARALAQAATSSATPPACAPQWTKFFDQTSGRPYWHNSATRETSWAPPPPSAPPLPPPAVPTLPPKLASQLALPPVRPPSLKPSDQAVNTTRQAPPLRVFVGVEHRAGLVQDVCGPQV